MRWEFGEVAGQTWILSEPESLEKQTFEEAGKEGN